ncbi:MAG: hypothetical protein R3330_02825 [Saprospiraceae bacterium]|nr:hypothetical protein [Saprospiraceae bacterium]
MVGESINFVARTALYDSKVPVDCDEVKLQKMYKVGGTPPGTGVPADFVSEATGQYRHVYDTTGLEPGTYYAEVYVKKGLDVVIVPDRIVLVDGSP